MRHEGRGWHVANHTPGPWTSVDDRRGIWEIIHDGYMLAQVWRCRPGDLGDFPAEANARIMAAAPELLAACKVALEAMTNDRYRKPRVGMEREYAIVRDAVAKATVGP